MSDYSDLIRAKLIAYFMASPHGAKTEFCKKTGVHPQNLKNWIAGRAIPLDEIDAIAKGLGYTSGIELLKPDNPDPLIAETITLLRRLNESQRREALAWLRGFTRGAQAEQKALSEGSDTG